MVFDKTNSCIRFYNGSTWSDCLDGTTLRVCAVKINGTDYVDFLCHNLGADNSLDPHTPALGLHGAMVQWGKKGPADWVTSGNNGSLGFVAAPTAGDANAGSIIGWSNTEAANNSWNSGTEAAPVKVTANDPCPDGFRVPTIAEWVAVDTYNTRNTDSYTWISSSINYGVALHYGDATTPKKLTLPAAGGRLSDDGILHYRGSYGLYWSSTEDVSGAYLLQFDASDAYLTSSLALKSGFSVRCIAE